MLHGRLFNITDFETGIRYDFLTYKDSDYNWTAFERREQVDLWGVDCYLCSKEDLIIAKLKWYNISQSEKQWEDLQFLLLDNDLDRKYLQFWVQQLNLETHGLLRKTPFLRHETARVGIFPELGVHLERVFE